MEMENILKLLKGEGLEITDNRNVGMGLNIISQPNFKYVSVVKREGRFWINIVGTTLTTTQSQRLVQELTKINFLVNSINNAIEDGL